MKVLFSIIVTTHYRPALLQRCLESILSQNFTNFEIILCADEGSIETKNVAIKTLRPCDKFLVLPGFKGPAETRNYGMLVSQGDRVIFIDDDDTFEFDYLSNLAESITDSDNIIFTNYTIQTETRLDNNVEINHSQRYFTGNLNPLDMYKGGIYPINSVVFKNEHAMKFMFDCSLKAYEDLDFMLNFIGSAEFKHIDIYGPNVHVSNSSTRNPNELSPDSIVRGYLAIWLKHPSPNNHVRKHRADMLKSFGVVLPESFF